MLSLCAGKERILIFVIFHSIIGTERTISCRITSFSTWKLLSRNWKSNLTVFCFLPLVQVNWSQLILNVHEAVEKWELAGTLKNGKHWAHLILD